VRDYPLSKFADDAKKKLESMEMPVPEADPAAVARMKFEAENHRKPGAFSRAISAFEHTPDVYAAAKSGTPQMNNPRQNIPANVPAPPAANAGFQGDVTVAPITGTSALDTKPDARTAAGGAEAPAAATSAPAATPAATSPSTPAAQPATPAAQSATPDAKSNNKKKNNKKNKKDQTQPAAQPDSSQPPQQ